MSSESRLIIDSLKKACRHPSDVSLVSQVKVAKHKEPTNFGNFVAMALEDVPISGITKPPQHVIDSNNPLTVLRGYNLLGTTGDEGSIASKEEDIGSVAEVTFYTFKKEPGYSKGYESTSYFKNGKLVSCSAKKLRQPMLEDTPKTFLTKMEIQPSSSTLPSRSSSSSSMSVKPGYYRKLKSIAELHAEHEKRKIIERHNELNGLSSVSMPPISKWKYVEIEPSSQKEERRSLKSEALTCIPNERKTRPSLKEGSNSDEKFQKQEMLERIVVERRPSEFMKNDAGKHPHEAHISECGSKKKTSRRLYDISTYDVKYEKGGDADSQEKMEAVEEVIIPKRVIKDECNKKPVAKTNDPLPVSTSRKPNVKISTRVCDVETRGSDYTIGSGDHELCDSFRNIQMSRKPFRARAERAGPIRSIYDFSRPRNSPNRTEAQNEEVYPDVYSVSRSGSNTGVTRSFYDFS